MPIRMTPDEGQQDDTPRGPRPGGGGGGMGSGGGSIGSLAPMLIGLLMRRPKLLIVAALLFGLYWFFGRGCTGGGATTNAVSGLMHMVTGANMDPAKYDSVEVFEPLADNTKNPLPEKFSLEQFAPTRGDQGQQGSCVAWASAYGARSIVQAEATKQDPNSVRFSPSFLYNQIKLGDDCQGSYIERAMQTMQNGGVLPWSKFAYTDESCAKTPNSEERKQALPYRIKGFQRLTKGDDEKDAVDLLAMKQHLAQGSPCVIGMMVGGSFMQEMEGQDKWIPTEDDFQMSGFGGHAMCVIGYDDYKFGKEGGFQLMNSWTPKWGNNGLAWVRYSDFEYFVKECYAVYPQNEGVGVKPSNYDIRFGLITVDKKGKASGEHIALQHTNGRVFRTTKPIAKGTRFKVEVTNNTECYTYVFGQETDGSSYVLFPYTLKHSPYCGITGTRVFPHDQSLTADEIGDLDVMAILVANQPIDYPKINEAMRSNNAQGLDAKLAAVLGDELIGANDATYSEGETFGANSPATKTALAIVLEIGKK